MTISKGTVDDVIEHIGFGAFQFRLMFMCGALWMTDAMEMMLLSFLLPKIKEEWNLTGLEQSSVGSVTFLGVMFGALFFGSLSDKFGRRFTYRLVVLWTAFFGLVSALSPNLNVLLLTRCGVGFGLGGATVAFSLFAEFVPTPGRGK